MTDYAKKYTLDISPDGLMQTLSGVIPDVRDVRVTEAWRLPAGHDLVVKLGNVDGGAARRVTVPPPLDCWAETAYRAHRLTVGRLWALRWLLTHRQMLAGEVSGRHDTMVGIPVQIRSQKRGEAAKVVNGLKGLARDGLISLDHRDGVDRGECSTFVYRVSDRCLQYQYATWTYYRPIGRLDSEQTPEQIAQSMSEATRAVLERLALNSISSYGLHWAWEYWMQPPARTETSQYLALENRGLLRWHERTAKGWKYTIPVDSPLIDVAAAYSARVVAAVLTAEEGAQ